MNSNCNLSESKTISPSKFSKIAYSSTVILGMILTIVEYYLTMENHSYSWWKFFLLFWFTWTLFSSVLTPVRPVGCKYDIPQNILFLGVGITGMFSLQVAYHSKYGVDLLWLSTSVIFAIVFSISILSIVKRAKHETTL